MPLKLGQGGLNKKLRSIYESDVFPRIAVFKPDFILVSAGFDFHDEDNILYENTSITEFDFEWVTLNLAKLANSLCEGRLVSVLEGGYNTNLGPISPLA